MSNPNLELEKVLQECQTGDIVLFSGNGFLSRMVEYFTGSSYSHVGIVVKDPNFLINGQNIHGKTNNVVPGLYLYNSDGPYEKDIETGEHRIGVQLVDLRTKIIDYGGRITIRRISNWSADNSQRNHLLREVYNTEYHKPYDWYPRDLLACVFQNSGIKIGDFLTEGRHMDVIFCSSLVAYSYCQMGLLSDTTEWSFIEPKYFADLDKLENGTQLETVAIFDF